MDFARSVYMRAYPGHQQQPAQHDEGWDFVLVGLGKINDAAVTDLPGFDEARHLWFMFIE